MDEICHVFFCAKECEKICKLLPFHSTIYLPNFHIVKKITFLKLLELLTNHLKHFQTRRSNLSKIKENVKLIQLFLSLFFITNSLNCFL